MYKKIIKINLVLLLISVISINSLAYGSPSDWAEESIKTVLLENLSSEKLLDTNRFQDNITREEFAELTVLLYAKAKDTPVEELVQWNPFYDNDNSMVSKAYNLGIVNGTGKDSNNRLLFSPTNRVTRQEIAVMLVRELSLLGIDTSVSSVLNFSDRDSVAFWAYDSVAFATENNILSGVGNNLVAPTDYATIEQSLVLIDRISREYNWIDNTKEPIFNYSNSSYLLGFRLPNYNYSELRSFKTEEGVKFIISNLVTSYKPDIKKQQDHLINILVNSNISYNAFYKIKNRIDSSYDFVSKKFNKLDVVYIDLDGNIYNYKINRPYIKLEVDTEFTFEYIE